jgi:glyoxylase-like metal-dependent hydrolase (beta-lactamase superfamily II)
MFAEDMDAVLTSLKKVLSYDSAWLYPAHGNRIETEEARKKFANVIK